jgi:hypothetical protein
VNEVDCNLFHQKYYDKKWENKPNMGLITRNKMNIIYAAIVVLIVGAVIGLAIGLSSGKSIDRIGILYNGQSVEVIDKVIGGESFSLTAEISPADAAEEGAKLLNLRLSPGFTKGGFGATKKLIKILTGNRG